MTVEDKRNKIECYCEYVGSCDKCGLSRENSPGLSNCFSHATDEEIEINYNYLEKEGDI